MNRFIYGKNTDTNVVSIEFKKDEVFIFKEILGVIKVEKVAAEFWLLYSEHIDDCITLKGSQHYRYAMKYKTSSAQYEAKLQAQYNDTDTYSIGNKPESFMVKNGYTLFNDMDPKDVSVLSFDIETTTLAHTKEAFVLLISNTHRVNGKVTRKLFKYDDYESNKLMIDDWCKWVRKVNPTVLLGHNIFGFDLPYLKFCAEAPLKLGRDRSPARFSNFVSEYRKDGSQTYSYNNVNVFGRQIIDTMFLSIKYAAASRRDYESFGLKNIIKFEGLERTGRIVWDFEETPVRKILAEKANGNIANWTKFCTYCEDDGDDALKLYDLMIPSYFYYTQSIPKTFQQIINSASGSQINSFMVRSYLQEGYGLPKATERAGFEGAISYGNPGIYKNVYKVDVASLYPSIIREYEIFDKKKDPQEHFLKMVNYFTDERLENKRKGALGDVKALALSDAQKIMINSAYGFLGAPGLNFNSPKNAALVTRYGREVLTQGIEWCKAKEFDIVNVDTDAFSFTNGSILGPNNKLNGSSFEELIDDLNSGFPDKIVWEDDGVYKKFIVLKAKNYIMDDGKKVTLKGSSIRDSKREPALRHMIHDIINLMLKDKKDRLYDVYQAYVFKVGNVNKDSIENWVTKKTVTKAVLNPERTNERRILDAIGTKNVQEGDKVYMFFEDETTLRLVEEYRGTISTKRLYKKLYNTVKIFENVFDPSIFPDYSLVRNKERI